jgi:isoleucyl-tRNA synthetase
MCGIAAHAAAPYKTVITHGWVVDGEGKQMHKSTGNAISPNEVVGKSGAEILRLWAAAVDYTQDIRCSDEILSRIVDAYRKFRNTLRYALGNLDGFNPKPIRSRSPKCSKQIAGLWRVLMKRQQKFCAATKITISKRFIKRFIIS